MSHQMYKIKDMNIIIKKREDQIEFSKAKKNELIKKEN